MKTKFTAAVAALSIAVSGMGVIPAKAGSREQDVFLFIIGAIAGAVVANNVAQANTPEHSDPVPLPTPPTHSTGPLDVPQTYMFDLDRGRVTSGRNADIWFEAVNSHRRYLTPWNGAEMAVGDGRNHGYLGCLNAEYSPDRVSLNRLNEGDYVCVKTSRGRISQFRINDITPGRNKTLHLGYTTWQ